MPYAFFLRVKRARYGALSLYICLVNGYLVILPISTLIILVTCIVNHFVWTRMFIWETLHADKIVRRHDNFKVDVSLLKITRIRGFFFSLGMIRCISENR